MSNGDTWAESFKESNITLNSNSTINVTLDRDGSVGSNRGNNFGENGGTNLTLKSNGGSSTLILTKKSSLSNLQFYHNSGNTISVVQNTSLVIDLGSYTTQDNRFNLSGGLIHSANGGSFTLKGIYRLSIGSSGGRIEVGKDGNMEIVWTREIKNIAKAGRSNGITNNCGNLVMKTEVGVFNSDLTTDATLASSFDAGVITHNDGTTTIRHREDEKENLLYNAGFLGDIFETSQSKNRHTLLNINGGEFNVVGKLYNGGGNGGRVGWIVGNGGVLNVSNTLYNISQDPALPSKIILNNTTIKTKTLENRANEEIYLRDKAHIQATTFTSTKDSKIYFIGSRDGFGSISAQSLSLNGEEFYQVGLLNANQDIKYLIATSSATSGGGGHLAMRAI